MKLQSLKDVFKIVEYKDGCVYRTQKIGRAWITYYPEDQIPQTPKDLMFCSLPTKEIDLITNRKVTDIAVDIDYVENL